MIIVILLFLLLDQLLLSAGQFGYHPLILEILVIAYFKHRVSAHF